MHLKSILVYFGFVIRFSILLCKIPETSNDDQHWQMGCERWQQCTDAAVTRIAKVRFRKQLKKYRWEPVPESFTIETALCTMLGYYSVCVCYACCIQ